MNKTVIVFELKGSCTKRAVYIDIYIQLYRHIYGYIDIYIAVRSILTTVISYMRNIEASVILLIDPVSNLFLLGARTYIAGFIKLTFIYCEFCSSHE